jgi:hypothetical protein
MLISISLELFQSVKVIGRDQIELGDGLRFRVTDWDRKNRCLQLEPVTSATPGDGKAHDPGSAEA